ncbi:MAG: MarC family protein [Myxococcota bacterium]
MHDVLTHAVSVFMAFLAIMNPLANAPIFFSITADASPDVRRQIARKALVIAFLVVVAFAALGKLIFEAFGLTIPALRLAGGIIIFLIGLRMLQGQSMAPSHARAADSQRSLEAELEIAVSPLAVPMLAGPGNIVTAMNFAAAGGIREFVVTTGAFFVLCVMSYVAFVSGERLVRYLGPSGITALARIMGLLLAVIGMQMALEGLRGSVAPLLTD